MEGSVEKAPLGDQDFTPVISKDEDHSLHPGDLEKLKRRHFNFWGAIGINYAVAGTPLAIGAFLAFSIGVGGSPVYIFGYILVFVFQMLVCLSLAELAGAFPHSAGKYLHFD
jgi:amino acid transporter